MTETTCSGCGRCCWPVVLPYTQRQAQGLLPTQLDSPSRRWMLEDLTPISRREGLRLRPDLAGRVTLSLTVDGEATFDPVQFYLCRRFDPDTRRCTSWETRPPTCRDYPHYGQTPDPEVVPAIPAECSFNADWGRPVQTWVPVPLTRGS